MNLVSGFPLSLLNQYKPDNSIIILAIEFTPFTYSTALSYLQFSETYLVAWDSLKNQNSINFFLLYVKMPGKYSQSKLASHSLHFIDRVIYYPTYVLIMPFCEILAPILMVSWSHFFFTVHIIA